MQNSRLIQACFPIKIDEVWIDRFCVRYDWWRRLQRTSSVSPVCVCASGIVDHLQVSDWRVLFQSFCIIGNHIVKHVFHTCYWLLWKFWEYFLLNGIIIIYCGKSLFSDWYSQIRILGGYFGFCYWILGWPLLSYFMVYGQIGKWSENIYTCSLVPVYLIHILQGYFTGTGIAPVPVKQPWRIWVNRSHYFTKNWYCNQNKEKHNKTVCIFYRTFSITTSDAVYAKLREVSSKFRSHGIKYENIPIFWNLTVSLKAVL